MNELYPERIAEYDKLTYKQVVSQVDKKIEKYIISIDNAPYLQIWNLFKITTRHMPPQVKRIIYQSAKSQCRIF